MLIKLLRTILLLVFFAGLSVMTTKLQQTITKTIQSGKKQTFMVFLMGTAVSLLSLAMYWSLTGLFSLTGVLVLMALNILGHLLYQIVGAISGFTLPQNEKKISTMGFILGAIMGTRNKWSFLSLAGLGLLNLLAMLVVFWMYPFRDPTAIVLITLLHFVVGQIVSAALLIMVSWSFVTSEHVDNDVRDSYLTGMFSLLFSQTALLLIGVILAEPSLKIVCAQRGWAMPNVFLVVVLPLVTFIFVGVLPFMIGIYRRRAEQTRVTSWYVDWLNVISELLKLPEGDVRSRALAQQFESINEEITSRYSDNALYEFYEERFYEVTVVREPDFDESQSRRLLVGQTQPGAVAVPPVRRWPKPVSASETPEQDIIINNYENLFKWDLRFKHLRNMLLLREIMLQPDAAKLAPYVDAQLINARSQAKETGQLRSVIAATLLAAFSWGASWAATNYGKTIVALIQRAVAG